MHQLLQFKDKIKFYKKAWRSFWIEPTKSPFEATPLFKLILRVSIPLENLKI